MSYGLLKGKNAIITGARGIAEGIASRYVQEGATVLVISLSESGKRLVEQGLAHHWVQADLSNRESLRAAFDQAMELLDGRIDVLVNCAGVQRRHEVEVFPMEDWDLVLETNLTAVMELSQLCGRLMIHQGKGKIVNIASMNSFFGGMRIPAYAAAKGGIMQLTRSFANAWADKGININAIAPGYIATEMNSALMADPQRSASILARIPQGRWGEPEDLAGPAVFLASDLSDYMNGAIVPVDGGYLGM